MAFEAKTKFGGKRAISWYKCERLIVILWRVKDRGGVGMLRKVGTAIRGY